MLRISLPGVLAAVWLAGLPFWACECDEPNIHQNWAELEASPNPVAFGEVPVSTVKVLDVTLTNRGSATVHLHGLDLQENPADFSLSVPEELVFPYAITPGGHVVFPVRYHPQVEGEEDAGAVRITSTDKDAPEYDLPLAGTAVQPILLVEPNPINFGSTRVLSTAPATLTVTHTGSVPDEVSVTLLQLTEDGDGDFVVQDKEDTPVMLGPGDRTTVHLSYTPQLIDDEDSGTFVIESTAESQEHMEVPLLGSAHAPHIVVSTTALNFGTVSQGSNPTLTFTIESAGTDPLTVEGLVLGTTGSQKFSLQPASIPDPIPPTQKVDVRVTYIADDQGEDDGSVRIDHNDPLERPIFVQLHGRTPTPDVQVVPDYITIRLANLSHTQTQDIRVYNLGDADLHILNSPVFVNPDGSFSIDAEPSQYPVTVAPGSEPDGPYETWTVRFTKDTATVDDMCTLTFPTDDPDEPSVTVTVIGEYTP